VIVRRDWFDLTAGFDSDWESPILAVMNAAFALYGALARTRLMYCICDSRDEVSRAFNHGAGIQQLVELDHDDGSRALNHHLLDHGPDGAMETGRALVYRDLGLPVPPPPSASIDAAAVREALRAFDDPLVLAASSLAVGGSVSERAASVRTLLQEATREEFGRSRNERLLRATLERGYMDPDGGHEAALLELNVSRATYFRRLADAVERVAARVLAG
jgi:hypothetical protein